MVYIDLERSQVETYELSANQCSEETKDCVDLCSRLNPPSDNHSLVSYNMWKDKVQVKSGRNSNREKLRDYAAHRVGYDPEQFSRPYKGKSRDFKAVITAVRFKQIVLKCTSRKRNLLKQAILANTMRRAEEDLLIRGRHRQLRRAQAVAEAKARQEAESDDARPGVDLVNDDALQSLEQFMQSLSSVTRS